MSFKPGFDDGATYNIQSEQIPEYNLIMFMEVNQELLIF